MLLFSVRCGYWILCRRAFCGARTGGQIWTRHGYLHNNIIICVLINPNRAGLIVRTENFAGQIGAHNRQHNVWTHIMFTCMKWAGLVRCSACYRLTTTKKLFSITDDRHGPPVPSSSGFDCWYRYHAFHAGVGGGRHVFHHTLSHNCSSKSQFTYTTFSIALPKFALRFIW